MLQISRSTIWGRKLEIESWVYLKPVPTFLKDQISPIRSVDSFFSFNQKQRFKLAMNLLSFIHLPFPHTLYHLLHLDLWYVTPPWQALLNWKPLSLATQHLQASPTKVEDRLRWESVPDHDEKLMDSWIYASLWAEERVKVGEWGKEKENGVGVLNWDKEWPTEIYWSLFLFGWASDFSFFRDPNLCWSLLFCLLGGEWISTGDKSIASPFFLSLERRYQLFNDASSSSKRPGLPCISSFTESENVEVQSDQDFLFDKSGCCWERLSWGIARNFSSKPFVRKQENKFETKKRMGLKMIGGLRKDLEGASQI